MNTIKIYFDTDGSIKELRKDFQLYQGQFHDKLLNVYVPTSVLAPDFTVENEQGQTIADFVASTSVKVGMKYIARNGSIKKSKNYYLNYLKVMTQNGIEYAVYERKLPKEFTTYVGQGQTAPVLVVNVVNMDVESDPAEVLSVVTTQECFLDVMPSADLDNDEAVEPSEWELMNAEINAVKETLLEKQDKTDPLLQTDAKTVVGAINENKANIGTNETAIGENSTDIAGLRNDVTGLQALLATGETPIGKMEGDELPTDEQLNAFVQSVVVREQRISDVVIFVLDNATTYKYTYTEDGWQSYEITTVDKADNSNYGIVEGTYTAEEQSAKVRNILADINNGKVEDLYVKDGDNYRNLKEFLGANKTAIANILDGTTPVALAESAEKDGNGNNIVNTYLTQTAGATKQYVQDYAVPKSFTNVYFISADGYVSEPPAVSETPAFSATTTGTGETEIIKDGDSSDLEMDLTASFDLSISNSYRNTFWVVASEDCNVQFRLVTQYKKPTEEWADLNIELSEEYPLVANNYERIDFSSQFLSLGTETVSLGLGDKIRQFLSVIVQVDTPITFGVFSNTVYPSTFNLIAQNYVPAGATSVYVDGSPVSTWNADDKMDKDNPTGTGALSINRASGTTIGNYSTTLGVQNGAAGECATALGSRNGAHGDYSVAGGTQSGAYGDGSVGVGYGVIVNGNWATGIGEGTSAQRRSQFVFGQYNTDDTGGTNSQNRGTYVEIVGNGTADNARSNARTMDWNGNMWLAGNLTFDTGKTAKVPTPTADEDAAPKNYVDIAIPVGVVLPYAGSNSAVPENYLICNGATISRTTYARLFSVIGTTYGNGDGSTTFNLPNLIDRFVIGAGGTYTLNASGGSANHSHGTSSLYAGVTNYAGVIAFRNRQNVDTWTSDHTISWNGTVSEPQVTNNYTQGAQIYGTTDESNNMPPYRGLYYIIRAK